MKIKIKCWKGIKAGHLDYGVYKELPKSRVVDVAQCGGDLYWGAVKILPEVIDRRIYYVRPTIKNKLFTRRWYKLHEPKVVAGRLLSGCIDLKWVSYDIEINHCSWLDGYDWEVK